MTDTGATSPREDVVTDDEDPVRCALLWTLARKHTWGSPVRRDSLLRFALGTADHDTGRVVVDELERSWFTEGRRDRGIGLNNDPDSQARVAFELRDECGYTELAISATLTRFAQAGGFDAYEEPPDAPR